MQRISHFKAFYRDVEPTRLVEIRPGKPFSRQCKGDLYRHVQAHGKQTMEGSLWKSSPVGFIRISYFPGNPKRCWTLSLQLSGHSEK